MEAPAIFKKDGLYYFMGSGCTGWKPNAARSAVAPSIWGPWTELGNPCQGENSETTFHSQSTYILPVSGRKMSSYISETVGILKMPLMGDTYGYLLISR